MRLKDTGLTAQDIKGSSGSGIAVNPRSSRKEDIVITTPKLSFYFKVKRDRIPFVLNVFTKEYGGMSMRMKKLIKAVLGTAIALAIVFGAIIAATVFLRKLSTPAQPLTMK